MTKDLLIKIALVLICVFALDQFLAEQFAYRNKEDQRAESSLQLAALRAELEKEITQNLLLVQGAANFIAVTQELTPATFASYAKEVMGRKNQLKNIGVARGFVMEFIYPLEGNGKIIGVDYRNIPAQWEQVRKARETGDLVVAGPLKLIQGGWGLIGRSAVFKEINGKKQFWGIVSAVIDSDRLFQNVGIFKFPQLDIAIRGRDGKGAEGEVFYGAAELFSPTADAIKMPVTFPSGSWEISAVPHNGWVTSHPFIPTLHALLTLFSLILIYGLYRENSNSIQIRLARDRLREAQGIAKLGYWRLDIANDMMDWSEETCAILGVDEKSINPTIELLFKLIDPRDREFAECKFWEALENNVDYSVDIRIISSDGTPKAIHIHGIVEYDQRGIPSASKGTVHDITERKNAENALKAEEGKLRAMADACYDAVIMIDADDNILFWSPAAERMFGWSSQEAMGQMLHKLIVPIKYHARAYEGMKNFATTGKGPVMDSIHEFEAIHKDGTFFPIERSVSSFSIDGHHFAVGILRDITERKQTQKELERLATTDSMTGLFNRGHFVRLAEAEIERSKRYGNPLSLILFDADKFKAVNDTYGHDVGDEVLKAISASATASIRDIDVLGRIGGEEFAVILPETDLESATVVAERLRQNIGEQSVAAENATVTFTVSLGVVELHPEKDAFESLLKRADIALYQAKDSGRNRWVRG